MECNTDSTDIDGAAPAEIILDQRKQYDRDFLLQLRYSEYTLKKPDTLPYFPEIIPDKPTTKPDMGMRSGPGYYRDLPDFTPGFLRPSRGMSVRSDNSSYRDLTDFTPGFLRPSRGTKNKKSIEALMTTTTTTTAETKAEEAVNPEEKKAPILKYKYKQDQWSPLNPEGKMQYDRDFLLQLQYSKDSMKKPDTLPNIPEIIPDKPLLMPSLDKRSDSGNYKSSLTLTPGFLRPLKGIAGPPLPRCYLDPEKVANVLSRLKNREGGNVEILLVNPALKSSVEEMENEKDISDKEMVEDERKRTGVNKESLETKSKTLTLSTGEWDLFRKMRSILNKLTPQKFQTLINQVQGLVIDTETRLKGVTALIWKQATTDTAYARENASLCTHLQQVEVPLNLKKGKYLRFRMVLLILCRKSFTEILNYAKSEGKVSTTGNLQKTIKYRRKYVGIVRFIGELFQHGMLLEKIILDCLSKLLQSGNDILLECFCHLLLVIGETLDKRDRLDDYFHQIQEIMKEKKVSARCYFMLQDVLETRDNEWKPLRQQTTPTTIDEVHKQADLDKSLQTLWDDSFPPVWEPTIIIDSPPTRIPASRHPRPLPDPATVATDLTRLRNCRIYETPSAWSRGTPFLESREPEEDLYRKVRSILNKLTPQKFQTLIKQVQGLVIDTETRLKGVTDIIFEKAISEPAFSVAYANMCRYLLTLKVPSDTKEGESVNFRVILLARCQREFEKVKDTQLDIDRMKKAIEEATEQIKAAEMKEELDQEVTKSNHRSLGNFKFIGELFKLKMLTETSMHDCVFKLLRSRDEENLECLCRLLSTIGKELESDKAKPRMDQYFQQMKKIVAEKKVSSRCRFMLQDVIDLRDSGWKPRRDENNPKTIDQIHKDAKRDASEQNMLTALHMSQQRSQPQHHQSRHNKPARGRPGGQAGGSMEEGWNTVSSKAIRNIDRNIDVSKLRTEKDLYRKVRSILNKLTPQTFQTLIKQVQGLVIDTETRLKGVTDIIFEKAISEPSFSVAYANMCRYLLTLKVPSDTKQGESVNFRVILLTRCQREYEKDKDTQLDTDRRKKAIEEATDPKKAAEMKEELEQAVTHARRRSIGNIRFIGELFKLKMLTETIMHDCVFKLLRSRDEENLECLCRLLSTIGKELESDKAKPRMDQYFQQMKKIVAEKKVSSRCRFMLQDVIDLRDSGWKPRRDENNPKTIDQIHKDAKREASDMLTVLHMSQQPSHPQHHQSRHNKPARGRPGGQAGGSMEEGWNTVSSNIDVSKLRTEKNADENIQLGPARSFGSWGRGSSGGGSRASQEGEKHKAPGNRSLVSGRTTLPSGTTSREGSRNRGGATHEMERPPAPVRELSEDEMEKKTHSIVDEYLHIQDRKEAIQCVQELNSPKTTHFFVYFAINHVLERSKQARQQTGHLLHDLINQKVISLDTYLQGLTEILQAAEDMEIDIPKIWLYLGELIGPMIQDGSVPLSFLTKACEPLKASGKAGNLMAEVLHDASQRLGHKIVAHLWRNNMMDWTNFVSQEKLQQFLKDKNLEFTVGPDSAPSTPTSKVSIEWITENLSTLLNDPKCDNEKTFDWIEANIPDEITKENKFIRALMSSVCSSAISGTGNAARVDPEVVKKWRALLIKYLDHSAVFELQALFALQALVNSLEHPSGVLRSFFDTLYDEEIISEDAFNQWETSQEEPEGKGVALKQVVQFFAWLREGEEEEADS